MGHRFRKSVELAESTATAAGAPASLPPFAALRAFESVFRVGGIRKAADQLGVDHAVVSRHVRLLEDWLGVALIVRHGNRLALTEEGERYHARISAALADLSVATHELTERRDSAPLRLWCVPGLAIQWLSPQLASFEREYPGFRVELKPTDEPPNLAIHQADADIRYYRDDSDPPGGRGLSLFELARPEVLAVTSPAMADELGTIAREDVPALPFIHEENDQEWRAWLRLNGYVAGEHLPGPRCWHAHLAIAAARQGRGIVLASRFLIEEDLQQRSLVPVHMPGCRPVVLGGYMLVAREDRWSMPALARLRHVLHDRARTLVHAD